MSSYTQDEIRYFASNYFLHHQDRQDFLGYVNLLQIERPWRKATLRQLAIDYMRLQYGSKVREKLIPLLDSHQPKFPQELTAEDWAIIREIWQKVYRKMSKRAVRVASLYFLGFSLDEIAKKEGVSKSAICHTLTAIRIRFKSYLSYSGTFRDGKVPHRSKRVEAS